MVSWWWNIYPVGAHKDHLCCKPFPDGPGWILHEVVDHRWAFQLHKLSRQTVVYFGRNPILKSRIFVENTFLRGSSWSEGTTYKAEISSAHTPLVVLAVVKVSEPQRVHITSYGVPKVPWVCIFGHIGLFHRNSSAQYLEPRIIM